MIGLSSGSTAIAHLVVGGDAFALEQFLDLRRRYGSGRVVLSSARRINFPDLLPKGPVSLRGQDNIEAFRYYCSGTGFEEDLTQCLLLKEGKWRPFVDKEMSRLLWGENFYTHSGVKVDWKGIFSFLDDSDAVERVNESIIRDKIIGIRKVPEGYSLSLAGGGRLECTKLYWAEGPWRFYDLYSAKEDLDDAFMAFCQESKTPSSLYVDFEFKEFITDCRETLFIPLSYTHDWGHFIGEFFQEKGVQKAVFVNFVDPDNDDEEVIAKRIRLFKRNITKIIPTFKNSIVREFLFLDNQSPRSDINDEVFYSSPFAADQTLFFIGSNGALRKPEFWRDKLGVSLENISHLTRGILSLEKGIHGQAH